MARARLLKPGFFTNEHLAELPMAGRLLFAGLWTLADRDGRVEDRPRRIHALLFPWDHDVAVDDLLSGLAERGFLSRYRVEQVAVIQITEWEKHQKPHANEVASTLPLPPMVEGLRPKADARGLDPVTRSGSGVLKSASPEALPRSVPVAVFLEFPTVGTTPGPWRLTEGQVDDWVGLFPSVDVRAEARKALAWVQANPGRRKTVGGMPRFLVGWLSKTTNHGGSRLTAVPANRAPRSGSACQHEPMCESITACRDRVIADGRAERKAANG